MVHPVSYYSYLPPWLHFPQNKGKQKQAVDPLLFNEIMNSRTELNLTFNESVSTQLRLYNRATEYSIAQLRCLDYTEPTFSFDWTQWQTIPGQTMSVKWMLKLQVTDTLKMEMGL